LSWECNLRTPVSIRGKLQTGFRMGPQKWGALAGVTEESAKVSVIQNSIVGFVGDPIDMMLLDTELDELTKFDLENITAQIEKHNIGPVMGLDVKCPVESCGYEWLTAIDWRYHNFFAVSSR
jgi:hypothetical protein